MSHFENPSGHLSDIINLYPEEEPWCAGYAPSQGRRCHMRTNAANRRTATTLLDRGTRYLKQGKCIDDILEDLAPLVLCTRWHQDQSDGLAEGWTRKVEKVQRRQARTLPTPPRRPSASTVTPRNGNPPAGTRTRVPLASSGFAASPSSVPRVTPARSVPPSENVSLRQHDSDTAAQIRELQSILRSMAEICRLPRVVSSSVVENTPSIPVVSGESVGPATVRDERARRSALPSRSPSPSPPSSETINPSDATATRAVSAATDTTNPPETGRVARSVIRTTTTSQNAPSRDTTARISIRGPTRIVTRRPIEGECPICTVPLLQDRDDDVPDSNSAHEENNRTDHSDVQTTWCNSQCGNNYHKKCIDKWIETCRSSTGRPTCPHCRANWRR